VNYSVEGELLTWLQDQLPMAEAYGKLYTIQPDQQDVGKSALQKHRMVTVLHALHL
jgi:hypothetical protein